MTMQHVNCELRCDPSTIGGLINQSVSPLSALLVCTVSACVLSAGDAMFRVLGEQLSDDLSIDRVKVVLDGNQASARIDR
jgi:hypothetical protein